MNCCFYLIRKWINMLSTSLDMNFENSLIKDYAKEIYEDFI